MLNNEFSMESMIRPVSSSGSWCKKTGIMDIEHPILNVKVEYRSQDKKEEKKNPGGS
jgi:hypothetical protein